MEAKKYELIIFGGGNAISLAIEAGKAGKKVAVVEEGPLGGTCPNRGCIPSKLLLGYASVAQTIRESKRFHIEASIQAIDINEILKETFAATSKTDAGLEKALPETVDLYRGHGSFVDNTTLKVGDLLLTGEKIVLATGSRPREPQVPGLKETPYWTSDPIFSLTKAPRSISIIGGGYIACELAAFFAGVGIETTLIYRGNKLLKAEDQEIQAVFQQGFSAKIPVKLETELESVSYDGSQFHLALKNAKESSTHSSEALLFAIGRVPNSDQIAIEKTDLKLDPQGFVRTDLNQKTSVENIFALGDVTGRYLFTHAASFEANYLTQQLLNDAKSQIDYGPMPHAVFSTPEIAGVGATEQDLEKKKIEYLNASVPFKSAAKGRSVKEEFGLCKFLLSPAGEILGCHIVGHEAATLLHEVIPVMKWRNHISSLTEMIHIHPALSEIVRNAARKGLAQVNAKNKP